jgi:hypothetical protein
MIPTFTIVTTLITIGVTALLVAVLVRINAPKMRAAQNEKAKVPKGGGPGAAD